MQEYKLMFLLDGKPVKSRAVTAADDTDAIFVGRQEARGREVEIWCGQRRVALIAPLGGGSEAA